MLPWNKLSEWKNKAGSLGQKVKGIAKEIMTADDDDFDQNDPFGEIQQQEMLNKQKFSSPKQIKPMQELQELSEIKYESPPPSHQIVKNNEQNINEFSEIKKEIKTNESPQQISSIIENEVPRESDEFLQQKNQIVQKIKDVMDQTQAKIGLFTNKLLNEEKNLSNSISEAVQKFEQIIQNNQNGKETKEGEEIEETQVSNLIFNREELQIIQQEIIKSVTIYTSIQQQELNNLDQFVNQQSTDILKELEQYSVLFEQKKTKLDEFQSQNIKLIQQLSSLENEFQKINDMYSHAQNKLIEHSNQLANTFSENNSLNVQIEQLNSKIVTQQNQIKKLNEEVQNEIQPIFLNDLTQILEQFFQKVYTSYKEQFEQDFAEQMKQNHRETIIKQLNKCYTMLSSQNKSSKLQETYNKLQESYTKLQETCQSLQKQNSQLSSDNFQLQKRLVDAADKVQGISMDMQQKEKKFSQYERMIADWDKNKREFVEEIKIQGQEIDQLKLKLKLKDQEVSQAHQLVQNIQVELKQMNELKNQIELKDEEIERLTTVLEEWQQENQSLQLGIQNVQQLNEQEQVTYIIINIKQMQKNVLIEKYESSLKKAHQQLEQCSQKLISQEQVILQNETLKKHHNQMQRDLNELENKYLTAHSQNEELKKEAAALHKKFKTDQSYQNNLVDRRVISKFLVNYFDINTEYQVKLQILETLSSVLNFSEEDKEKIGISDMEKYFNRLLQNDFIIKQ